MVLCSVGLGYNPQNSPLQQQWEADFAVIFHFASHNTKNPA
uniref:Uncharacterized protein n=1 Tax=Anguilla anguilla TaxID=7936 RepID=A0A0E9SWC5_ANGAN